MRADAIFRFDTTFDVYGTVYAQDPISFALVGTYEFLETTKGILIPGSQGNLYLATKQGLPLYSAIRNVHDRDGNRPFSVAGDEYDMYVNEASAQSDALGSFVGWVHLLRRTLPRAAGSVTHNG